MIEFFQRLFATDFMPHGYCIRVRELIWLHQISDVIVGLSYFLIPIALVYLVRVRRDLVYPWMFWLFGLFILSCGTTHFLAAYVIWHPVYRLDGVVKAITALASFPTAVALIRLVPKVRLLPSPEQLRQVNEDLERRVAERTKALEQSNEELRKTNEHLKTAEAALARQLALTRAITDNATTALFIMDDRQHCVFMNPAAEKLTGYTLDEVKGRPLHDAVHHTRPDGSHYPLEECPIDRAFPEHNQTQGEETFVHKDGSFYQVAFTASPLRQGEGAVGTIIEVQDITDRKRREMERRRMEHLLDAVLDALPVSIIIADPGGRLVRMNRASERIWGSGAPLSERVEEYGQWVGYWPDTNRRIQADEWPLSRAIQRGKTTSGELVDIERFGDGNRRVLELSAAPVCDEDKNVIGGVVAAMDVTDRVGAERAVRESEATLSAVLDALPVGVVISDREGRLVRANDAHRELWGRPPQTENWEQYGEWVGFWPETGDRIQAHDWALARALLHGEVVKGELVECEPFGGGARRFYLNNAAPVRDSEGKIVAAVAAEMDITARRRTERALRASEEEFRTLANAIPQLCWMARPDGHIFWYNQRWYEYTGTTQDQMEGWGWQKVHDPEVLPVVMTRWTAAIAAGEPMEVVFPLRGADGVFHPFLTRVTPVRNAAGAVVRWFGTNTDISEQKRVEAELRRANHDLQQFAYSASHDLQEPLRNVSIYTQLIERRYASVLDEQAHEWMGYVIEGAQRMAQLVSDLLAYTQLANAEDEPAAPVSVEEVLDDVLDTLHRAIDENGAIVTRDPLPSVVMRRAHVRQILQNLIGNAIKYRKETEPPRISISVQPHDSQWKFTVRDNGIGIAPDYHRRIFGIFKRLHGRTGKYPGTGIGLAICQRIIERYGGKIWVESEPGAGAAFHFTVPGQGLQQHPGGRLPG